MQQYIRILLCLFLGFICVGCSQKTPKTTPTTNDVIIITTSTPASTTTSQSTMPTASLVQTPLTGTKPGDGTSSKTVTFAFDSFPSYLPAVIMERQGLLSKRGYTLQLIPFQLNNQNKFSEDERYRKLQNGEWDVLAASLDGLARRADPAIGAITTVIDESAGADKLVAKSDIATINDLRGKRIAYSEGSVGEYFLYSSLNLAGLGPSDVTLVPQTSIADAVTAFTSGQVDAVSAWEPDILAAEQQNGKVLIASDTLRSILDVLITARPALNTKPEAIQAFHEAWYEALKLMTDAPEQAEQAIISWGNTDWSTISASGSLRPTLERLAQATLGANQIAFLTPETMISRLRESQKIWAFAKKAPPQSDLNQLVDGQFVTTIAQEPTLFSTRSPVNNSFLLTAQINLPLLSAAEQLNAQEIVRLPIEQIDFDSDSPRLTAQAMADLTDRVLPVLHHSRLYLKIEGSAAWPGPVGRFTADEIHSFAYQRATSVATFLSQQGVNSNRLMIYTIDSKFPNSLNEDELTQDRIVRFTLMAPPGR